MAAPTISNDESVQDALVTACQGITAAADYRTTVQNVYEYFKDPDAVNALPSVAVLLGAEKMISQDTTKAVWNTQMDVMLLGYTRNDAAEALLHDLKRVAVAQSLANLTGAAPRWQILTNASGQAELVISRVPWEDEGKVLVSVAFTVRIFSQTATF